MKYINQFKKYFEVSEGFNDIKFQDMAIKIEPDVFSPYIFTDSSWFALEVYKLIKQQEKRSLRFLEIGCGCGIVSMLATKAGAKVTATDRYQEAVENTKQNLWNNKLYYEDIFISDVFDKVNSKFDIVFWNHPFHSQNIPKAKKNIWLTCFDPGYKSLDKYLQQGLDKLRPGGKLLLGTSKSANTDLQQELFKKYRLKHKILKSSDTVKVINNSAELRSAEETIYQIWQIKKA